jgi:hypothetical protein
MTGPCWAIPLELVVALADAKGTGEIVRLRTRGATFQPHAILHLAKTGFGADCIYEEPAYPGRRQVLFVRVVAVPHENALETAA